MRYLFRSIIWGLALTASAPSLSQQTAETYRNAAGQLQDGVGTTLIAPMRAGSTTVAGTIGSANVYQSALAAAPARRGCLITNTSANAMSVFLGAPGSASAATSIPLPAGGSFNCATPAGLVITDQISIASATQGSTFVVVSQ